MAVSKSTFISTLGRVLSKRPNVDIRVSPLLIESTKLSRDAVLQKLETPLEGLSGEEASRRLEQHGPNSVDQEKRIGWHGFLGKALLNPLVILLLGLASVAFLTGDSRAGTVMLMMVVLGVLLRFIQESKADTAAAKLKAMVNVTATVIRDGQVQEIPLSDLVPGDAVSLAAGDMIPADIRILSSKDLFVTQSSFTGESMPVEKCDTCTKENGASPFEMENICFLGTNVESGSALAVVVTTGMNTYLGGMAGAMATQTVETSFDKGINRFTWLMIRFMGVLVPIVFLINGWTKHSWTSAFFFSVAVGVSLPYSPLAHALGFTPLPFLYWPILAGILLSYVLLTQGVKVLLLRRQWI